MMVGVTSTLSLDHHPLACEDRYCAAPECVAYLSYCLDGTPPLAMPSDPEHPANRCDACGCAPTPTNPTTTWPGAPADVENGPSAADLPYTLCEACDDEPDGGADLDWATDDRALDAMVADIWKETPNA